MNRVLSLQAMEDVSIKSKKKKGSSGLSVLGCGASSMGSIALC